MKRGGNRTEEQKVRFRENWEWMWSKWVRQQTRKIIGVKI